MLKCTVLLLLYADLEHIFHETYMVLLWEKDNFQLEENSSSNHFPMTVFPLSFFKLKTMEVQQAPPFKSSENLTMEISYEIPTVLQF